jgi:hypothetical protein
MLAFLCVVTVLAAMANVAAAWVIAGQVSRLVAFCRGEPNAHPVRRHFNAILRREKVRKRGIPLRANP